MKLILDTKYDINDTVIVYFVRQGFRKCRIVDIHPPKGFSAKCNEGEPLYECRTVEYGNAFPSTATFSEQELYTTEDFERMIQSWKMD